MYLFYRDKYLSICKQLSNGRYKRSESLEKKIKTYYLNKMGSYISYKKTKNFENKNFIFCEKMPIDKFLTIFKDWYFDNIPRNLHIKKKDIINLGKELFMGAELYTDVPEYLILNYKNNFIY